MNKNITKAGETAAGGGLTEQVTHELEPAGAPP